MTTDRLAEMRRVAEAATPGPWTLERSWDNYTGDEPGDPGGDWVGPHGAYSGKPADNAYIATFDPPTVLALLDVVEALASTPFTFHARTPAEQASYEAVMRAYAALSRLTDAQDADHPTGSGIGPTAEYDDMEC